MAQKVGDSKPGSQRSMPLEVDWFLPALQDELSLEQSLSAVKDGLHARLAFVSQLQDRLKARDEKFPDRISELKAKLERFEQTLDLRLGMLQGERVTPWFRPYIQQSAGPFSSTRVFCEPVLSEYLSSEVSRLQLAIKRCWQDRTAQLGKLQAKPSLWTLLISLRHEYLSISELEDPFAGLQLRNLKDESLPKSLESLVLRRFLLNVQNKLGECEHALDALFRRLDQSCQKLWEMQDREQEILDSRDRLKKRAQEIRDTFRQERQKRQTQRAGGTNKFRDALQILGFDELPDQATLRNRYLKLAKQHHPDLSQGDGETFKKLSAAYKLLNESVIVPHEL